ncbi:hypothetical protein Efla_001969 [Eimeria flavescens]
MTRPQQDPGPAAAAAPPAATPAAAKTTTAAPTTAARTAATTTAAAATAAAAATTKDEGKDPAALLQQLAALADDDDNWEADPAYLEYLEAKYRDVECPLFLESIPADLSSDPQLEALQLLAYDGETPQSVAARCREQGKAFLTDANQARKKGNNKQYGKLLAEAEAAYHRALAQGLTDKKQLSLLHSNVALCCLKRGQLLRCIDSSREAIKLDPQNLKAYLRGAKASLHLELHAQAERFASMGLQAAAATAAAAAAAATAGQDVAAATPDAAAAAAGDPTAEKELRALLEEARRKHLLHQQRRAAAAAQAEEEKAKSHTPAPAEIFKQRGVRVCPVPPSLAEAARQVAEVSVHLEVLNGDYFLLLPLLLLLDEYSRADAVSQADERLSLLQQLKPIFPSKYTLMEIQQQQQKQQREGEATDFPPWDHEKKYLLEDLVAYYECGLPGGVLICFPMNLPLALLIKHAKRYAGIAAFHILVKDSPAHAAFVSDARIEKLAL